MPQMSDDEFIKSIGGTPFKEEKPKAPVREEEPPIDIPQGMEVPAGMAQGAVLGPLEAIAQGGRWMSSRFDPDVMTVDSPFNRALTQGERFRRGVESSTPGMVGEIGGSFATGFGEEAALARILGKAPTTLRGLAGRTVLGAASGATSQPSESLNELSARAITGGALGGGRAFAARAAAGEKAALAHAQAASRTAAADEQIARAAMAGVKKKDPMYQQLAGTYGDAREAARQARLAIPGNAPPGFWPFLHNLPHYFKLNLARWLMNVTPPRGGGAVAGELAKQLENPQ